MTSAATASVSQSPPKVRLASGSVGGSAYEVKAHREAPGGRSTRPCLSVFLDGAKGSISVGGTTCGPLTPFGSMFGVSTGEGKRRRTVWPMAYEPAVRRVKLGLLGHPDVVVPLTLLSWHKSRKAGLRRFRYGVLAISGPFCLTHTTTFDVHGGVIRDADEMIC